jgi:hypothetical protein
MHAAAASKKAVDVQMQARSVLYIHGEYEKRFRRMTENVHGGARPSWESDGGAVGNARRDGLAESGAWSEEGSGDEGDGEIEHGGVVDGSKT